ncbi:hypothetical protein KKE34_04775 [Patescibacteria group bacterium]|nr:hypothetical protein [Patescibacteria group bacterium]MBU1885888.1 hypothetical protein [Patescibacteria group bacterium]
MSKVPSQFQPLLPSSEVKNLDIERDKKYIITSFLKNATLEAWRWMLKVYRKQDIIQVVKTSRHLKEKDVNFWVKFFHLPRKEIRCLRLKSQSTPKSSWEY